MRRVMRAEFQGQRNEDGTCGGRITINGEVVPRWHVQGGSPADLRGLYLEFVAEHLVCPKILEVRDECLPAEFVAKVLEWLDELEGDGPDWPAGRSGGDSTPTQLSERI
ncbi:MAG TPA: hypothetical protein VG826_35680 [Pirellulales bacterium]|nr:hypothetical protein [Pirellulales bacterium]